MDLADARLLATILPITFAPKLNEAFPQFEWRAEDYRLTVRVPMSSDPDPILLKDGTSIKAPDDRPRGVDVAFCRMLGYRVDLDHDQINNADMRKHQKQRDEQAPDMVRLRGRPMRAGGPILANVTDDDGA